MWKCSNTWSLPILISRAAYPYFLINTLLTTLLFNYRVLFRFKGHQDQVLPGTVYYAAGTDSSVFCPLISDFCFYGGHSKEDPPVPIPNTEVKLFSADGTARATVWESRSPPFFITKAPSRFLLGAFDFYTTLISCAFALPLPSLLFYLAMCKSIFIYIVLIGNVSMFCCLPACRINLICNTLDHHYYKINSITLP